MAADSMPPQPYPPQPNPEFSRGPLRVVIEQPRRSWLGRILKWGFLLVLFLILLSAFNSSYEAGDGELQEQWHSLSKSPLADKVAIVSLTGTIMTDEGFVKTQLDRVREDDRVKAIVLRVDSPGGTVTASDNIYHRLKKLAQERQIPLVVSMGSIAASGGYYVAMAAGDKPNVVFAEPTTWTGSIGVVIPHYDVSGLLQRFDVQDDSIASNPLKLMGSPTRRFPEQIRAKEQEILQGLVDSSFEDFKAIVLASRGKLRDDKELQDKVFTGQIFTAKQAVENQLIDKVGFLEDAIDRAIEMARLKKDDTRVVKYVRPMGVFEQLFLGAQSRKQPIDLAAVFDLMSPRAYYLFTWPGALGEVAR